MALSFINNFETQLSAPMQSFDAVLPIPPAAAARLDFTGGREYLLTISYEGDTEIVRVKSGLVIERAQEGTVEVAVWPAGATVFCGITAGMLASIFARLDALEAGAPAPSPEGQILQFTTEPFSFSYPEGSETMAEYTVENFADGPPVSLFGLPATLIVYSAGRFEPAAGNDSPPSEFVTIGFAVPSLPPGADVTGVSATLQIAGLSPVVCADWYSYEESGVSVIISESSLPAGTLDAAYYTPGEISLYVSVTGSPTYPAT